MVKPESTEQRSNWRCSVGDIRRSHLDPRRTTSMTLATAPARFTYRAQDGVEITAYHWKPVGERRGAVQLTHGMGEHVLRYADLVAAMTARLRGVRPGSS